MPFWILNQSVAFRAWQHATFQQEGWTGGDGTVGTDASAKAAEPQEGGTQPGSVREQSACLPSRASLPAGAQSQTRPVSLVIPRAQTEDSLQCTFYSSLPEWLVDVFQLSRERTVSFPGGGGCLWAPRPRFPLPQNDSTFLLHYQGRFNLSLCFKELQHPKITRNYSFYWRVLRPYISHEIFHWLGPAEPSTSLPCSSSHQWKLLGFQGKL